MTDPTNTALAATGPFIAQHFERAKTLLDQLEHACHNGHGDLVFEFLTTEQIEKVVNALLDVELAIPETTRTATRTPGKLFKSEAKGPALLELETLSLALNLIANLLSHEQQRREAYAAQCAPFEQEQARQKSLAA